MVELAASDIQSALRLRRCILSKLFTWFKAFPRAVVELRQLNEACESPVKAFNWNLVYLEKKGWIELDTSEECLPYVACTAVITGSGIDLVEDGQLFDERFEQDAKK